MDEADGEESGVGLEKVSSVSEVLSVEGMDEVSLVEGMLVGGGTLVDPVGVVESEVLLSEKQVKT